MKYLSLHSAERVASVLVVAAVACVARSPRMWMAIVISAALGHYVLSLVYSKKQIAQVAAEPLPLALFAGLTLSGLAFYFGGFPLIVLFGVHHVFNEIYLLNRTLKLRGGREAAMLRTSSIMLNFFLYFATVRHYQELQFLSAPFLFAGVAVSGVAYLAVLARVRGMLTAQQIVDCCIFEVVGLALLAVSFYHQLNVFHVVFYHVIFWGVYPLQKMAQQGGGAVRRYVGYNAGVFVVALLVSPVSFLALRFTDGAWDGFFRLTSNVHIMMSFALSTAHPAWITRWFQLRGRKLQVEPGVARG